MSEWLEHIDWAVAMPGILTGLLYFALAAVLYRAEQSKLTLAFVIFLVARGLINLGTGTGDTRGILAPQDLALFAAAGVTTSATLWFLYQYTRHYLGARRRPWLGPLLITYAAGYTAWILVQPSALYDPAFEKSGPLELLDTLRMFAYLAAAWVIGRGWLRATQPGLRRSHFAVALGFALYLVFLAAQWLGSVLATGTLAWFFDPDAGPWWNVGQPAYFLAQWGAVALIAYWSARAVRARDPQARLLILTGSLAFASGLAVQVSQDLGWAHGALADSILDALWTSTQPVLIFIALARRQFFDIDLKIRFTIKQSTVAAIFIAVVFGVSEAAAAVFSEAWGTSLGIAAAAVLVFAIAPLQRVAERLATAATPGARPIEAMGVDDRASLYRDQAALLWADGSITAKERRALDGLRERLGLKAEEAGRIESAVMPS